MDLIHTVQWVCNVFHSSSLNIPYAKTTLKSQASATGVPSVFLTNCVRPIVRINPHDTAQDISNAEYINVKLNITFLGLYKNLSIQVGCC